MFVPHLFLEKFLAIHEAMFNAGHRVTDQSLQRVMEAKDSEVKAVIAAKDDQISFLKQAVVDLRAQIDHERHRAEAAIDILLTKNGEAGPIRNADLIRTVAEKEAAGGGGKPDPLRAMSSVMRAMAGVGEDDDDGPVIERDEKFTVGGIPHAS